MPGSDRCRLPVLSPGSPLAEEVPALIEGLLELPHAVGVHGVARAPQLVLVIDESVDPVEDLFVGHASESTSCGGNPRFCS